MVRVGRSQLAVLAALAVFALGCGEERTNPASPRDMPAARAVPVAAEPAALRPPGTELVPDVEVQDGSWLVGTVFPAAKGHRPKAEGWQAVLVVDGDPATVWDRYAVALGLHDRADARRSCVVMNAGTSRASKDAPTDTVLADFDAAPPTRFLTESHLEGENRLRCEAMLGDVSMVLGYGASQLPRSDCLDLEPVGTNCRHSSESHLFLQIGTPETGDLGDNVWLGTDELRYHRSSAAHVAGGGWPHERPLRDEWIPVPDGALVPPDFEVDLSGSRLPAHGEPLDDGLDRFLGPGWVVPEQGRSLVAPAELIQCNSGLVAVLEIDGEPIEVVRKFDGAEPRSNDPVTTDGTDPDGRAWAVSYLSSAGGHHLNALAVAGSGGGTSEVLITECGD